MGPAALIRWRQDGDAVQLRRPRWGIIAGLDHGCACCLPADGCTDLPPREEDDGLDAEELAHGPPRLQFLPGGVVEEDQAVHGPPAAAQVRAAAQRAGCKGADHTGSLWCLPEMSAPLTGDHGRVYGASHLRHVVDAGEVDVAVAPPELALAVQACTTPAGAAGSAIGITGQADAMR